MLHHFLKITWRNLWRKKIFTLINLSGLSLGITSCLIIFTYIKYELTFDHYHKKADKIYRVVQQTNFAEGLEHWSTTAYPLAEALRNDFQELELVSQVSGSKNQIVSIQSSDGSITKFEEDKILYADPFYLKTFDFDWLAGNSETALEKPLSVVLSKSLAKKFFGENNLNPLQNIGKSIYLDNEEELIVTGVVDDLPGNTSFSFNMLIPFELYKIKDFYRANNWSGNYQGTTFIVLPENVAPSDIEQKIANWKSKYLNTEDDNRIAYFLQPLKKIHNDQLYSSTPGSYNLPKNILWAASIVAIFILFIACTNYINMSTILLTTRTKEVGVRKVMGSRRFQLVLQFFAENAILLFLAVLISLAFSSFLIEELNSSLSIINLNLIYNWESIALGFTIGIITLFLAGVYPALVLSNLKPVRAFNQKLSNILIKGLPLQKILIVLQFVIVMVLIISTLVINAQMSLFKNKDLGFVKDAVITTFVPDLKKSVVFHQQLINNPRISKVSFNSGPPTTTNRRYGTTFRLPSQSEEQKQRAEMKGIDTSFIDLYNLQLIAGRNIIKTKARFDEFIVNEKLVKSLGWTPETAIGKNLVINEGEAVIVGVVKDFHNNSLQEEISPCILINWSLFLDQASIKLSNSNNESLQQSLNDLKKKWENTFTESVFKFEFLDDFLAQNYAIENIIFQGFKVFSSISIFIGLLGLFGLSGFITVQRTKEIGIRKVLGASLSSILFLLSQDFIKLIAVSFIIAIPIANYFASEWLKDFVYRINLTWWLFALPGLAVLIISLLVISSQTIRTALTNPTNILRNE